jgi:hypothetical protein
MSQKTGVGRARIGARYKIHDETVVKHPSEKSRFRKRLMGCSGFAAFCAILRNYDDALADAAAAC